VMEPDGFEPTSSCCAERMRTSWLCAGRDTTPA
jgi:hypothetical protein